MMKINNLKLNDVMFFIFQIVVSLVYTLFSKNDTKKNVETPKKKPSSTIKQIMIEGKKSENSSMLYVQNVHLL